VHFIHVGNMNNKGTQALFISDINAVREMVKKEVFISVSTTDIVGVKRLNLSLDAILPPAVDIPYEKADRLAAKFGYGRGSLHYKSFALFALFCMFVQVLSSVFSSVFVKAGMLGFYRSEVLKHVRNCDLVISHSDESFKETASLLPLNPYWVITWWSMLVARTWDVLVAKSFGKPVILFPNSVGPFRTWIGRWLARLSLGRCDYVLIRDSVSFEIVGRLGINARKILTFDTALLFNPSPDNVMVDYPRPLMGVSPGIYSNSLSRQEVHNYIQAHATALDAAIEKHGFSIVFLPHYVSGFEYDDLEVSKLIQQKMKNKSRAKIITVSTVEEFKLLLDQTDMIISSKMHPAVLGVSGAVPVLCIAYDHKQTSFFERLKMANCTLNIRSVSSGSLSKKIDQVWNQNNTLGQSLKNQIPSWQADIKKTIKRVITPYLDRIR